MYFQDYKLSGILACFIGFTVTLGLAGCPEPDTIELRGMVSLDQPVVNAAIHVYHGEEEVYAEIGETGVNGTFFLEVPPEVWTDDFILRADGGTIGPDGPPFSGTLTATILNFSEDHSFYDLNPVTTILAAYLLEHSDLTYAEAETAVKAFLEIPDYVDILNDLAGWPQYFDPSVFVSELEDAEDWAAFIEHLVQEIDNSSIASHPFVSEDAVEGEVVEGEVVEGEVVEGEVVEGEVVEGEVVEGEVEEGEAEEGEAVEGELDKGELDKGFAAGLATGAGVEIGQRLTGWALDEVFGEGGGPSNVDILKAVDEVKQELSSIKQSISQLEAALQIMQQELLTGQQRQSFNVIAALMSRDIAVIETFNERFLWLLGLAIDGRQSQEDVRDQIEDLVDAIEDADLLQRVNNIHSVLTGAIPGQQGLYELFDSYLFAKSWSKKHLDELGEFYLYWAQIQLQALNLLLEVDHFLNPEAPVYADLYVETYMESIEAQSDLYLRAVEKQLSFVVYPDETRVGIFNWNFDRVDRGNPFTNVRYTSESIHLRDADARVAAMRGKIRSTVIRIFRGPYWGGGRVPGGKVDLRETRSLLQLRGDDNAIHDVQKLTAYTFDQSAWHRYADHSGGYSNRQYGRYDFGELPPGRYTISSLFNKALPIPKIDGHRTQAIPKTYMDFVINVDDYNPVHNMLILYGGGAIGN